MSLLDKTTKAIKKLGEAIKDAQNVEKKAENTNQTTSTPGDWIGSGGKSSVASTPKKSELDYGTYKDDLDRLTDAQKKYQVAQLKSARDKALANLDVQEQTIKPTYQNARNMTSAASQANARSFAEYMANRGLTNSGAAAQAEINRGSALQNNLGNINTAEANAFRDIANQRTQVQNDYANGVATANAAIQQNYLNNLLNYNEQQRQYVNNLRNQALGQYADDYQAYMNTLNPNSLEYLQAAAQRGTKIANSYQNANTPQMALASIQAGNINYNNAAALGWTPEQAQAYYNNYQAQLQAQAEAEAEQKAWDRYIEQAKLANDTMKARAQATSAAKAGNTNQTISSATQKRIIDHNFVKTDEFGDTVEDTQGIADYISMGLEDGTMSEIDAKAFAKEYNLNYYQLTPEYKQIFSDMENTVFGEQGLYILGEYKKLNPGLDDGLWKQLEEDFVRAYK